jgi:hypothetical protein
MVIRELDDVSFRRDSSGSPTLDLVLPLTHLGGTVVDADGKSVDRAIVSMHRDGGDELVQTTATNGTFVVNALPPGSYLLRAESFGQGDSDVVRATVAEDGNQEDVKLVTGRGDQLRVLVASDSGPVAGANVFYIPTDRQQLFIYPLSTDADGVLQRPIPRGSREADIVVDAPGFGMKIFHHTLAGEDLRVRVYQSGGMLRLHCGTDAILGHDGAVVAAGIFGLKCTAECTATIAAEPGEYKLCHRTGAECAHGFLAPGGTLDLAMK